MRIGVVIFPDSNSDVDSLNALTVAGVDAVTLWHESPDLHGVSAVVLPGGFAYGDYIRAGVIARFSPVMGSIKDFAAAEPEARLVVDGLAKELLSNPLIEVYAIELLEGTSSVTAAGAAAK